MATDTDQQPPQARPGKRPAHVRAAERLGSILCRVAGRLQRQLDDLDKSNPEGAGLGELPGKDWIELAKWASKTAVDIADQHTKRLALDRKHPPPPMPLDDARAVIEAFLAGLSDEQAEQFRAALDRSRGDTADPDVGTALTGPIDVDAVVVS